MKIWVLNPPFLPKFSRSQRSPAVTKSGTMYFPIWLAYCVGVLEEAGHEVIFTDAPARGLTHDEIFAMAGQIQPRLIVMDTSTPSIANDLRVAEGLKKHAPGAFITLVGTHVSALAEETLRASESVDAIARREYEHTIRELAALLSRSGAGLQPQLDVLRGLSFRSNGNIVHNADRPHIENLDELPWVSRVYKKHLRIADYFNANALYPMVTLISGRGCPFRCSFCVYPQTLTGRRYRFRSISDVVDEMEYVIREFPEARSVFFEDDTLTANRKRCLELADAIIVRGVKIPWEANARADLDLATMRKLRAAGCRELCVGFESGNQTSLTGMRKGIEIEQMFQFMRDARTAGVLVHGCFMFGFPGETRASILNTIALAVRLKPDTAQFYPVMVYPGTEAYVEYRVKGWLTADSYAGWLTPEGLHNCVVKNEHLSSRELVQLADHARRSFYLRPTYVVGKMLQALKEPGEFRRTARAASVFFKHLARGSRV
ncbi:MAG: radical SAM protein [Kiritimatiellae bacterium]|nr:radical SAM protein [Kiritimatiellia bacterium]